MVHIPKLGWERLPLILLYIFSTCSRSFGALLLWLFRTCVAIAPSGFCKLHICVVPSVIGQCKACVLNTWSVQTYRAFQPSYHNRHRHAWLYYCVAEAVPFSVRTEQRPCVQCNNLMVSRWLRYNKRVPTIDLLVRVLEVLEKRVSLSTRYSSNWATTVIRYASITI